MARYIDADKLKIWWDERYSEKDTVGVNQVISSIENCPSADVVEVVRCKDCKYYNDVGFGSGCGWCEELNMATFHADYCSYG